MKAANHLYSKEEQLVFVRSSFTTLERRGIAITPHFPDWIYRAGMALAYYGESGREIFHIASKLNPSYNQEKSDTQFSDCLRNFDPVRITWDSFVKVTDDAWVNMKPEVKEEKEKMVGQPPAKGDYEFFLNEEIKPDYLKLLKDATIDLNEELAPPPVCLEVVQGQIKSTIGTRGNFSLLIGKPKSRKTFLLSIVVAASLNSEPVLGLIKGSLPANKRKVLYFDTEQGKHDVQKAGKRVLKMAAKSATENLQVVYLRKYDIKERLKIIETAIYKTKNLGLVVIDGVRDLTSSINDEEQASMIANKFLKWTEECDIHIMSVLHQNKGDTNARGHLGTELQNKAETVLSITKKNEVSLVEPVLCRDMDFQPFAFGIDENGIPVPADPKELMSSEEDEAFKPGKSTSPDSSQNLAKSKEPGEVSVETHKQLLELVFRENPHLKYNELLTQVKHASRICRLNLGDNKAKEFITWYQSNGHISKQGKEKTKGCFYQLEPVPV
ncbi:AAA family ATPase [Adhaeribacter rhizoryzae]|uniref:AAA family ATPase n=1 Tax=Adhaeribacter rhizoryzae TaxID=2607907 RepID=A0A5M6DLF5_9BACT|nr:AAA family ATPase [Adhaeribacter rhizoryzae]KAA5548377.1 AAA family ATPase [Adhaeribacter rhizoryzae]